MPKAIATALPRERMSRLLDQLVFAAGALALATALAGTAYASLGGGSSDRAELIVQEQPTAG